MKIGCLFVAGTLFINHRKVLVNTSNGSSGECVIIRIDVPAVERMKCMKKIAAVWKSVEQCVQIRLLNLRFDVCEKYGGMFLNDVHEHFVLFKRSERRVAVDVKFFLARLHFFLKRR